MKNGKIICYALYDFDDDDTCYGCYEIKELAKIYGISNNFVSSKLWWGKKGRAIKFCGHWVKAYRYEFDAIELGEK